MFTKRPQISDVRHTERNNGSIPESLNRQMPWGRILIRSGFYASECTDHFDFNNETEDNVKYFIKILNLSQLGGRFDGNLFYPFSLEINEQLWLKTIEQHHGGAEGGKPGFNNIELQIMDTFIAGFTRWINYIGIGSGNSCDGHGVRIPHISLYEDLDKELLSRCIKLVSNTKLRLVEGKLRLPGPPDRTIENIRPILLEIAEAIHAKRDDLAQYVKADKELFRQFSENLKGQA